MNGKSARHHELSHPSRGKAATNFSRYAEVARVGSVGSHHARSRWRPARHAGKTLQLRPHPKRCPGGIRRPSQDQLQSLLVRPMRAKGKPEGGLACPPYVPNVALDHDDFGLNQSKVIKVIDFKNLERDGTDKPYPLFLIPLYERSRRGTRRGSGSVSKSA
jgi:hypothetical protein